jgi:hypothetical protein
MVVVYAFALSFMSKYLYQYCSPKPMTRVDINDNNQSSNKYLEHFLDEYYRGMLSGSKSELVCELHYNNNGLLLFSGSFPGSWFP